MTLDPDADPSSAAGIAGALAMTRLVKMARPPGQLPTERDQQFDAFAKFLVVRFDDACAAEKLTQDQVDNLLADIEERVAEARQTISDRN